jgi:hypothetical protein
MFTIDILPSDGKGPRGKVADAEIVFRVDALGLAGLKLIGFSVWTRGAEDTGRARDYNVTMPARTYSVNGERRSFALLRAVSDVDALAELKTLIVAAYIDDRWARLHGVPPAPAPEPGASAYQPGADDRADLTSEPARVASPELAPILAELATNYVPVPMAVVRARMTYPNTDPTMAERAEELTRNRRARAALAGAPVAGPLKIAGW